MQHPTDRIAHTMAFVITVVEHRLEQEIADWVHSVTHLTMHKHSTTELHLAHKSQMLCNGNQYTGLKSVLCNTETHLIMLKQSSDANTRVMLFCLFPLRVTVLVNCCEV